MKYLRNIALVPVVRANQKQWMTSSKSYKRRLSAKIGRTCKFSTLITMQVLSSRVTRNNPIISAAGNSEIMNHRRIKMLLRLRSQSLKIASWNMKNTVLSFKQLQWRRTKHIWDRRRHLTSSSRSSNFSMTLTMSMIVEAEWIIWKRIKGAILSPLRVKSCRFPQQLIMGRNWINPSKIRCSTNLCRVGPSLGSPRPLN